MFEDDWDGFFDDASGRGPLLPRGHARRIPSSKPKETRRPAPTGMWLTADKRLLDIRKMENVHLLNTIAWVERQVRSLQDSFCDQAMDVDILYPEHKDLVAEARRRKLISKSKKQMVTS